MNYRTLAATALTCGVIGGAGFAQTQEDAKVLVDLVNIQADIAQELGIDQTQVPMTVMAPIDLAATACGEDASTLAQNSTGANEGSGDSSASGDAASGAASGSGDASGGTSGSGDAAASGDGAASGGSVDSDGGDAAQGCIAKQTSPELTTLVQQEMSGATTTP